jgi:hypothetical protein
MIVAAATALVVAIVLVAAVSYSTKAVTGLNAVAPVYDRSSVPDHAVVLSTATLLTSAAALRALALHCTQYLKNTACGT